MHNNIFICTIFLLAISLSSFDCASQRLYDDEFERIHYKSASDTSLYLHRLPAKAGRQNGLRPTMVFFFGGGWKGGSVDQFKPHAKYFSNLGIECFLADYRVEKRHGTTPFEAVEDAKSAVRFIRENANRWQLHPDKVIAAGGSAGGHLAAAAGNIERLDKPTENLNVSSRANALVLFNPVFDNGPGEYGYDRVGDRYLEISPVHNISRGAPPTIVFFGTEDPLVSVETSRRYQEKMQEVGARCDLHLYDGQKHGFFNFNHTKYYHETIYQSHLFLHELGYVSSPPTMENHMISVEKAHAHNDYRHPRPLIDALEQGFISVEADILHQGDELFIGHDREELETGDLSTLEEWYLRPLYERFTAQGSIDSTRENKQPFYLWVDIKYNADIVYRLLINQIQPYLKMLTRREEGAVNSGAVTIILSGDRPFDLVLKEEVQYLFLDGRKENIDGEVPPEIMPFISENITKILGGALSTDTLSTEEEVIVRNFVRDSHDGGYQVRFWNTPDHMKFWKKLLDLGVDLVNTDNLKGLRDFLISQE